MLTHELGLPEHDPKAALEIAITKLKPLYLGEPGDWPRTLWAIVRNGLTSHYLTTGGLGDASGITREHVIGLRRLARQCGGWFYYSQFVLMDEWLKTEGR